MSKFWSEDCSRFFGVVTASGSHKGKRARGTFFAAIAAMAMTAWVAPASRLRLRAGRNTSAALSGFSPDNAVLVYVDYVTGLDNLMTTIPGKEYRNNISAFAKFSTLFKMPTAIVGEENDYYGTFLPEIKRLISDGGKTFAPRTTATAYTPDFESWLKSTGRKNVIIGGISIDNCTLHTSLDLLRNGYNVFVIVDVSSTNSKLAEDAAIQRLIQADGPGKLVERLY